MKVIINPLSVNQCWKGKRYKTDLYNKYERDTLLLLPNMEVSKEHLHIIITFGFSSKLKDIDNPIKPFLDILQKKYKFNDRDIYKLEVEKTIVAKGKEYINFEIKPI